MIWQARARFINRCWSALAQLIREDRIDILVDLTMHMADGRPLLFARKPALIQIAWLAYPGTTGVQAIDYWLPDPWLDPSSINTQYSERSIYLADTFQQVWRAWSSVQARRLRSEERC